MPLSAHEEYRTLASQNTTLFRVVYVRGNLADILPQMSQTIFKMLQQALSYPDF